MEKSALVKYGRPGEQQKNMTLCRRGMYSYYTAMALWYNRAAQSVASTIQTCILQFVVYLSTEMNAIL